MCCRRLAGGIALVALCGPGRAQADVGWSGSIGEEMRLFFAAPQFSGQQRALVQPTLLGEVELTLEELPLGVDCYVNPYARIDGFDSHRSILDLQTTKCRAQGPAWSLSVGYDVESWGVLEFVNPVDALNQRDITDDVVSKRKLGQPMVHLMIATDAGTFTFYESNWFTPLSFPGARGRLRPQLAIHTDEATFESTLERASPELAFRYGNTLEALQVSASYFYGYQRDPTFGVAVTPEGQPYLFPMYWLQHQGGLELQATLGSLLLKSEGALRLHEDGAYSSAAFGVGLEYDFGALLSGGQTLSALLEYDHDSRSRTLVVPFTNDLFGGARVALNDPGSTELTVWADLALPERRVQVVAADASTRIGDSLRLSARLRVAPASGGTFADLRRDDYLALRLVSFF